MESAKKRIIMHVDMDSFYPSVERVQHPEFASKPIIVGADPRGGKGRGVVSSCSYEARRYGVRSGMAISKAYKLCPNAIFLPVDMKKYERISDGIMKLLRSHADRFERGGIDEAYLDVTQATRSYESAEKLALAIKKEVRERFGLTCSIGVAPNKAVAKIASNRHKPDGLTIVKPNMMRDFLDPLPVSEIMGVGRKTQELLGAMGIKTIEQLAKRSAAELTGLLGKYGIRLWQIAKGTDEEPVEENEGVKSISREHTFSEDVDDFSAVSSTLESLAKELLEILRGQDLLFKTVTLKIRFEDFSTFTRSLSLGDYSQNLGDVLQISQRLLRGFEGVKKKVRLVGLKLSKLKPEKKEQETMLKWVNAPASG